jgi:prophage regulatory protein
MIKLLGYRDLKDKGIKFSRMHIHRLVKQNKFPKPFKTGVRTNTWTEPEIDRYIIDCIAKRDAAAAA